MNITKLILLRVVIKSPVKRLNILYESSESHTSFLFVFSLGSNRKFSDRGVDELCAGLDENEEVTSIQ